MLLVLTIVSKHSSFVLYVFSNCYKQLLVSSLCIFCHFTANDPQTWTANENADGPMAHKPQQQCTI